MFEQMSDHMVNTAPRKYATLNTHRTLPAASCKRFTWQNCCILAKLTFENGKIATPKQNAFPTHGTKNPLILSADGHFAPPACTKTNLPQKTETLSLSFHDFFHVRSVPLW
jgi:hypothetical protein